MPWYDLIRTAGEAQTLARARKAIGRRTIYQLGAGGMKPGGELDRLCDCSGFVAWAIGIPRQLPPGTGGWLDTDAYCRGGAPAFPGLLTEVEPGETRPGDLLVYPDYRDAQGRRRQGHIGVVSAVDGAGRPTRVIHCSVSNSKGGDAVQETAPTAWKSRGASKTMRVDYDRLRSRYAPGHVPEPAPLAPAASGPLQHRLLAGDPVLQAIAAGSGHVLRATGGVVDGAGPVQDALNHLGARHAAYRVDLGGDGRLRGRFGPRTEQAVRSFQATHGIRPDGLIGRDTLKALDAALQSFDRNGGVDRTRGEPPTREHLSEAEIRRDFIERMAPAAQAAARATGVPASITLAQGALESNWGRSLLSVQGKNFFGIKGRGTAGSVTMPTVEWENGQPVRVRAAFRAYRTLEESCEDHARLLAFGKWKNGIPIYGEAMRHAREPRKFAGALEGVYATDPDYAEKLWRVMDQYQLETYDV